MIWVGSARFIFSQALKLTTCWAWVPSCKSWRTKPSKMFKNCLEWWRANAYKTFHVYVCCGCGAVWTPVCKTKKFPKTGEIETATKWVCGLTRIDEDWRRRVLSLLCNAVRLCVRLLLHSYWPGWVLKGPAHTISGSWFTLHTLPNEKNEKTWEDIDKQWQTMNNMDDMILYDIPQDQGISRLWFWLVWSSITTASPRS